MSIDSFTNATAREAPNVASDAPTDAIDVEIKQDSPIETKVEPPAMAMANHAPDETVEDDPMAASSSAQRHVHAFAFSMRETDAHCCLRIDESGPGNPRQGQSVNDEHCWHAERVQSRCRT